MADTRVDNPRVLSAATAIPPHRVEQREIKEFARRRPLRCRPSHPGPKAPPKK